MSERIKYIIGELNKPPFSKSYNLISFDSLGTEERLQILTDVLGEIDKKNLVEIRNEDPEETTIRLLTTLRVLKYDPGPDPMKFRQGLVQGDKSVINPILEWLLKNRKELATRAYLAEFLVKIEVPMDMMADSNIASLYNRYENLIEEFKKVHKECELVKTQGKSTAELRADIETMEKEKEIVIKRTERLMRKLESVENKDALLEAIRKLRIEKERSKELAQQRQDEMAMLEELQQTLATLSQQLNDLRMANSSATPHGLVKQIEEECRVNEYLVKERLPVEVEKAASEVEVIKRVALQPAPSDEDIDALRTKVELMTEHLNVMMQDRVLSVSTGSVEEEAGSAAAQQANAASQRRREQLTAEYDQARATLDMLNRQIEEQESGSGSGITEEEFKEYVAKLKVRSTLYKAKRSQIASLVAESGVLARTLDILNQQAISFTALDILDDKEKMIVNVEEMSKEELLRLISEVNSRISTQKSNLTPLMDELKILRQQYNEVLENYSEKKRAYDAASAKMDSTLAKLRQDVKQLRKEYHKADSEAALLAAKSDIADTLLNRAQQELVTYTEKGSNNSIREKLTRKIGDQERQNRDLKDQQKMVRESQQRLATQTSLWQALQQLLECKQSCLRKEIEKDGIVTREEGAETLVLQ